MKNIIKMAIAITTILFLSSSVFAGPSKAKYYYLQAKISKLNLSAPNHAGAKLPVKQKAEKYDAQRWRFIPAGNGYYYIKSKRSGLHLQVSNNSNNAKAVIWDSPNNESSYQQWKLERAEKDYVYIRSKGSGLYLDVKMGSKADGAIIWQFPLNKTDAQKWKLVDAGKVYNINEAISASLHVYKVERLYLFGHKFNFGDKNHGTPLKVTKLSGGKTEIKGVFVRSMSYAFDDTYRFTITVNGRGEVERFKTSFNSYNYPRIGAFTDNDKLIGKLPLTGRGYSAKDVDIAKLYDKTKNRTRSGWEEAADEIAYLLAVAAYNQR